MAQSKSFFDDVKKELECPVCQEQFSQINEPKIMKCLHTFCKTCLEAWLRQHREGQLSCPTCRQITECPNSNINSLRSNLFYKQMLEIVEAYSGQGKEHSPHCGLCDEKKVLKFYCFECNSMERQHCLMSTSFIICGAFYIISSAFPVICGAFVVICGTFVIICGAFVIIGGAFVIICGTFVVVCGGFFKM